MQTSAFANSHNYVARAIAAREYGLFRSDTNTFASAPGLKKALAFLSSSS